MLTKRIISILLIAMFILPVEAIRANEYGTATVKFNFTDYSGNPITAYTIYGKIYNDEGTLLKTLYHNPGAAAPTASLKAFASYKIEMELFTEYNSENNTIITRSFKTRLGYKTVNIKLPASTTVEWTLNLQEWDGKYKIDYATNFTTSVKLYDPETNKLVKSANIINGKATINVKPNTYNIAIDGGASIDKKVLNNLPIYKTKTSNVTINRNEWQDLYIIFNRPLKYKARITWDQDTAAGYHSWDDIPAGSESYNAWAKKGKPFNVTIYFGVDLDDPKRQGKWEKQFTLNENKTIKLWEFDYSKYDDQKEYLPVDICSTDSGDKEVTLTDPVYKTTISQNEIIGASCIRASGENGQDVKIEKWNKVEIELYNRDTGKREERTITVKDTNNIMFGSNNSTSAIEKLLTVNVYEAGTGTNNATPTTITNWTGTIRRMSDGEFVGGTTYTNGDKDMTVDNTKMIYLPKDNAQYEMTISANGFMQEVKRFKAFGPKTINVYMTRSSQMKPVTIKLEAVSDNKGLIIKDIYMYASYYYKDETDTLQKGTLEMGGAQIPIEAIVSSTATTWQFTVNLPENKSVYLMPTVYFESGSTSFTYIGKPQKHTISSLQTSASQEINIPINVIGTDHKILVIEKNQGSKDIIDNVAIQFSQIYFDNSSSYGIKSFELNAGDISIDQNVWLPDGIFLKGSLTTGKRDMNKLQVSIAGPDTYTTAGTTQIDKTIKTPVSYDKSKYDKPAIIFSYQKSTNHLVNVNVTVDIRVGDLTKVSYDRSKMKLYVTSKDGKYKDSTFIPGDWILGLPEGGEYTFELNVPYKLKTGDKNILNSKGEVWKTVPVYERKNLQMKQELNVENGSGAIIKFDADLEEDTTGLKIKSDYSSLGTQDKTSKAVKAILQSGLFPGKYIEIYGISGSKTTGVGECGNNSYPYTTYFADYAWKNGDPSGSGGYKRYKIITKNGVEGYYVLHKPGNFSGMWSVVDDARCFCEEVIPENPTLVRCHGQARSIVTGEWESTATLYYSAGGGEKETPNFESHEKKITVRLRNQNPTEVFSLSRLDIDPSKRGDNNEFLKTYKNTFVEFIESDLNYNMSGKRIKKVWIEKQIASQYQKTWILPIDPDKTAWVYVSIPDKITGMKKDYQVQAPAGNNVTVEVEYKTGYEQVELTPGTKYEVTGTINLRSDGTIDVSMAGTGTSLKISGLKCDNDSKECYNATKAIMDKINNRFSTATLYVSIDSDVRDNYGALSGRLYIDDVDVAQELINQGVIVNVKSKTDPDANTQGTKHLIIKAKAGNSASFTGKKVYVAVNPEMLPTMRKLTQDSSYDAYAYWGGIEHELQVDPSDPTSTKETTISLSSNAGDNVKLLFYTSDLKGFIERTWISQLLKEKTETIYNDLDKAINEMVVDNMERSSGMKQGSFSTAVKNIATTTANYQYVNVTIPQLGASTYTDYKTITVNINATSTGGFRANLIDLTAAASIVGVVEAKKSAMTKFRENVYLQKDAYDYAPPYSNDDFHTYENSKYKMTYYKDAGTWKTTVYDKVNKVEIPNDVFSNSLNRNMKFIKTWDKAANSGIMKIAKALTLQPFTKWLSKAFSALGSWGEAAYRWALVLGMGMPMSGMPLVKIQTSMESKNGVLEATNASTSFQVQDWFRNYFNKPLVAKTTTVQIKARKYSKIIVRMAAMGHEPYTSILTINDTVWTNESLDVYASMKTNLTYSYTNFETFMNSFPLLQERIEEFALAPEMYATSSERASLVDYMESGIETMMDSFIKDFTPFMQNKSIGSICESQPWLPECKSSN